MSTAERDRYCAEVGKLPGIVRRRCSADQVVATDASPERVHIVVERGGLALRVAGEDGDYLTTQVLGPGGCVLPGHEPWASAFPRWSFVALLPSVLLETEEGAFLDALRENHDLAVAAAEVKADQLASLLRHQSVLRLGNPLQRVASALLYLAGEIGESCSLAAGRRIHLRQELIAAVAQLTRQTANPELRCLHDCRYVYLARGMVCVLDHRSLLTVAGSRATPGPLRRPAVCKFRHPECELDCVPANAKAYD